MRQLRSAWQKNAERVGQLPFLTDEELHDIYERVSALPPLPPDALPPLPRQDGRVLNTVLGTVPSAAVAALLLLLFLPVPKSYATTPHNVGEEDIEMVNYIIKDCDR